MAFYTVMVIRKHQQLSIAIQEYRYVWWACFNNTVLAKMSTSRKIMKGDVGMHNVKICGNKKCP